MVSLWGDRPKKPSLREVDENLAAAMDNLYERTLTMSRADFDAYLESERQTVEIVHDSPWNTVEFHSYAESCAYRKPAGKDGIASICTHKGHVAASTGIASCSKSQCPVDPRKAK